MLDIGFPELLLVAVVGLLVIGPDRLPETLRTIGLWLGRLRRSFVSVKAEIEKEIGMDEVKRQLHNEAVMEEMKRIEQEVHGTLNDAQIDENKIHPNLSNTNQSSGTDPSAGGDTGRDTGTDTDTDTDTDTETTTDQATSHEKSPDSANAADIHIAESEPASSDAAQPQPAVKLPRSEAQLEAAHARKLRQASQVKD